MRNEETPKKGFPKTFWAANSMELFERWAYYGVFAVFAIYLTDPISEKGLGFSHEQKGILMGVGTFILYLLPILSGALADRFGYKKMLMIAYAMLTLGYFLLGQFTSYPAMFITFLFVAMGAALFKPIIVSTVAKTTDDSNSTIGFGIFYTIVNIGAFIGPYVASRLRDQDWKLVFLVSSAMIAFNFVLLFLFYKEPIKGLENVKEKLSVTLKRIGNNTLTVVIDLKFMLFLLLMAGFWTMYMQLFFTLPVYIKEWVDTSVIYNSSPFVAKYFGFMEEGVGVIRPELMENLTAFFVIAFQFLVSAMIMKIKPINTIIFGTGLAALGMILMGYSPSGWYMIVAILVFALGEMSASPRSQEYVSKIAPPDKTALYLGFSFLSIAIGNFLAGILSGSVYGSLADKDSFIRNELLQKGFSVMPHNIQLEGKALMTEACSKLNTDPAHLTELLRLQYHPEIIWTIFGSIGIGTMILLWLYNRLILKRN